MMDKKTMYAQRLKILLEKKQQQTIAKVERFGFVDEDDYGSVLPPEGVVFTPFFNDAVNQTFYGAGAWGDNFYNLLKMHPVSVDAHDALAGKWMFLLQRMRPEEMDMAPVFDYSYLRSDQEKYGIISGIGKMQHFAPDYRIGLRLGWGGLLQKVRRYQKEHDETKRDFYEAEAKVILGIQDWIARTIAEIERQITVGTDAGLKANLAAMAETNRWILENPPRTLREACQWLAWFNMASRTYDRDGAGGQLDALLQPYYERDLQNELIDDEDAIFYLACLLLNDPHYYQVAGPDRDGKDLTSRISFLILEAAHRLKTTANITIRVHDGLDEELFRTSLRNLFADRKGCPRYSGDQALVAGYMKNGYSLADARCRIAVGCNWMALPGREYTLNDTVKINLAKVFEVAYYEMMDDPAASKSVAELYCRFAGHLEAGVSCIAVGLDFHLEHQKDNAPELLLNLLCYGPIETGRDASDGGVEFYNMCVDAAGLATVADSFAALEQRIEKEGLLSWEECTRQLRNNFADGQGETVRLMLGKSERYGQGESLGDRWALKIARLFTGIVKKAPTPGGRNMIPGLFSWANTIEFGGEVGATPNGRQKGKPISHGANPNPGFRRDGAFTAMARAIAMVQPGYGNTAPFQLELNPGLAEGEEAINRIGAVIKTHFKLGGTLININILDAAILREAHKNPMNYPDLIVRVTGFTAYFISLSPEFRQLVVDRIIDDD